MKKIKFWFRFQKQDLTKRLASYSKKKFFSIALLAAVLLTGILKLWLAIDKQTKVAFWDQQISEKVLFLRSPGGERLFVLISWLGTTWVVAVLSIALVVFLAHKRRKRAALTTLLTLVGSMVLIYWLKRYFGRFRPSGEPFSFPSGHASLSIYFYGLIAYLTRRFARLSSLAFRTVLLCFFLLVVLVTFSRVYLGVHYLSDVVAGLCLGGIWLLVAVVLIDFFY